MALVLLLSACTSSHEESTDPPETTRPSEPVSQQDLLELLAPDAASRDAMIRLMDREQAGIARCMKRAGYDYFVVPSDSLLRGLASPDGSPEIRRRFGYGRRVEESVSKNDNYARSLSNTLNRAYSSDLYGDPALQGEVERFGMKISYPETGCIAESREEAYGSLSNYGKVVLLPQAYRVQAAAHTRASTTYQTALAGWSGCMSDRFDVAFRDPAAYSEHATTLTLAAEIEASLQDLACAREVGLLKAVYTSYKDYVETLAPSDAEALRAAAKAFKTASR